jgi:periplasmic protein TonB
MFEDATFESTGSIRTGSQSWMIASLALNSSIMLALVLMPLINPQALPRQLVSILMTAPPTPPTVPPPAEHPAARGSSLDTPALDDPMAAPRRIPASITMLHDAGPVPTGELGALSMDNEASSGWADAFGSEPEPHVVHARSNSPLRVPSALAAGLLIRKVIPQYPALAKVTRTEGVVILSATIARDGTIADLRVVSGPAMLEQAALDAVSQWRYRPYLLNGEPVAVETTVNVVFSFAH